MSKIKDLDKMVRAVLADDPPSRNSDVRLTQQIWIRFYPNKLHRSPVVGEWSVDLNALFDLPREDNVKRCRAKIQNDEKKFIPTRWDVAQQRKWNEAEWREYVAKQQSLF